MAFEFRKSSYSPQGGSGTCVEVAGNVPGVRAVRDSKVPGESQLVFAPESFTAFVAAVKTNRFDR